MIQSLCLPFLAVDQRDFLSLGWRPIKVNQALSFQATLNLFPFIFTLRDSSVEFVCADMPDANILTIGAMATIAQHEREVIGDCTHKALVEKKTMLAPS